MRGPGIGLRNLLWLGLIVAVDLSLYRGAFRQLSVPAIGAVVVLLNVALTRLLVWGGSFRAFDYGFLAAGLAATLATIPYNSDPQILHGLIRLYRDVTGDVQFLKVYRVTTLHRMDRASLSVLLVAFAVAGGVVADRGVKRTKATGVANESTH
ncbi:hypothetical protein EP7_001460 [Isosphaeraceae bacterium EP7]